MTRPPESVLAILRKHKESIESEVVDGVDKGFAIHELVACIFDGQAIVRDRRHVRDILPQIGDSFDENPPGELLIIILADGTVSTLRMPMVRLSPGGDA